MLVYRKSIFTNESQEAPVVNAEDHLAVKPQRQGIHKNPSVLLVRNLGSVTTKHWFGGYNVTFLCLDSWIFARFVFGDAKLWSSFSRFYHQAMQREMHLHNSRASAWLVVHSATLDHQIEIELVKLIRTASSQRFRCISFENPGMLSTGALAKWGILYHWKLQLMAFCHQGSTWDRYILLVRKRSKGWMTRLILCQL